MRSIGYMVVEGVSLVMLIAVLMGTLGLIGVAEGSDDEYTRGFWIVCRVFGVGK